MRIIIRPMVDPEREIDMTDRLVAAIAEELWRLYGGNDRLNWVEAERHLKEIIDEVREEALETQVLMTRSVAAFRFPRAGDGDRRVAGAAAG